ncbi:cell division protein FtsZ [Siphonobacter sp. BAB-5404]|nr:cell division protein FtsZ [Siphonobacter sp. SORGH_AS_0500]
MEVNQTVVAQQNTVSKNQTTRGVKIIGIGGAGCSVLKKLATLNLPGVELIPCHTDFSMLKGFDRTLPLGTIGAGSGLNDQQVRQWASTQKPAIRELLDSSTGAVILVTGLGGGTGSGAAPIIAEIARQQDLLTVACVTMPFSSEGYETIQAAEIGLKHLVLYCDSVVAFSLDNLEKTFADDLSITEFYAAADDLVLQAARMIPDIVITSEEINTDLNDVRAVLSKSGPAFFTQVVIDSPTRLDACLSQLNQTFEGSRSQPIRRILLLIKSSSKKPVTMLETRSIVQALTQLIGRKAELFKIALVTDESLEERLQLTILTGGFIELDELK